MMSSAMFAYKISKLNKKIRYLQSSRKMSLGDKQIDTFNAFFWKTLESQINIWQSIK